jgi:periodic tryptophan protein 2
MKFNYKLRRVCGAYYGYTSKVEGSVANQWNGTNLLYDSTGNLLISAVSNRIQIIDLKLQSVRTLGVEARSSIAYMALSPDDALLIVVDVKNYAMLINMNRGIVLHRLGFKQRVRDISFSPGRGKYLAITQGKNIQIWCTPSLTKREFAPLVLHRTYTGLSDDATCLAWSSDGTVIASGSRDCTVRIWTVNTVKGFEPISLTGHRRAIVGLHFARSDDNKSLQNLYTISKDGTFINWNYSQSTTANSGSTNSATNEQETLAQQADNDSVTFFSPSSLNSKRRKIQQTSPMDAAHNLLHCAWDGKTKHYFHQAPADVTATSYCEAGNLIVVGFSSGLFALYELPSMANIHTLSVGTNQLIKGCILNKTGEWLALGCPPSQQLLVWEWQSETYVLKQRGHAYGMSCMAYSPDGVVICTGGEDGKVKLWNASSGFCYVTLEKSHTAPITAVAFANSSVVLSASLDGTVRAHDLHRYRTFKTLTTPSPVQFLSLAVDEAGEIVCAGTADPFHIYAWNLQTSKVLDIFTGHTGPVCELKFLSSGCMLVSASWDGTVKTWDLYKSNVPTESLQHTSDVVCVACRPDGKQVCSGSIGGLLSFWNVEDAKLLFEIDGRHDIVGGRKVNDRMASNNNAASRYFTSISFSADGTLLLAGGNSKYVCIYEISQQILLKKIQITFNRSLDGVLDEVRTTMECQRSIVQTTL